MNRSGWVFPIPHQSEFKRLSKRARSLLRRSEGADVEFKRALSALDTDDLVAFANSPGGGAVLVGVREVEAEDGSQRAEIAGCTISDRNKLRIVNKALSCIPPVRIEVFAENTGRKPFYRVEIPSSADVPHCTPGGTYKTREDGRLRPLAPQHLLSIYLEKEAARFAVRFRKATAGMEEELEQLLSKALRIVKDELKKEAEGRSEENPDLNGEQASAGLRSRGQ